ncbi:Neprilysin-4 [Eumeta japonica]|uniref:Neprilysin-4 n=1 Tax=Eumeta variegata TaxID=151549 RepID=A0A4C1VDI2_EUMVA|nr:Neprilysin-4 [Eumeta japonica]
MSRAGRPPSARVPVDGNGANFVGFLALIVLTGLGSATYFTLKKPPDDPGDPSERFVVKNIPKVYTKLEGIEPEERDVLEGFRTSFLPHEKIVLVPKDPKIHSNDSNESGSTRSTKADRPSATRIKRMNRFNFAQESQQHKKDRSEYVKSNEENVEGPDDSEADANDSDSDYESGDDSESYDDDDDTKYLTVVHPEPPVDRGPLDDVVEQARGQPELEEGEMGASAHLYKPGPHYAGYHSFWKGQGDRTTIRTTQANIMKQYMDMQADPCQDFYQYACGNWASLNPIPADKAGYDTFEMLRENLDNVMKDLLEFKSTENIVSSYPGNHLDLDDNFLLINDYPSLNIEAVSESKNMSDLLYYDFDFLDKASQEILNISQPYNIANRSENKTELLSRIRRYLDTMMRNKSLSKIKTKIHKFGHKVKPKKDKLLKSSIKKQPTSNESKKISSVHNHSKHKKDPKSVKYPKAIEFQTESSLAKIISDSYEKLVRPRRRIHEYKIHRRNLHKFTRYKRDTSISNHYKPNTLIVEDSIKFMDKNKRDPAKGDAVLKARFLYKSCMNYDILKKRGHQPLLDLLSLLGGWPILDLNWNSTAFNWIDLMAKLRLYNNDILISEWVGPDIKNSDEFVIQFDQTSLGLPTREYFLQANNKVYLEAYKNYLVKIALLLGGSYDHVVRSADDLITFETRLAKITSAPEDRRNVSELYRRMPLRRLETLVPEIHWRRYLCIVMNRTVRSDETIVLFALNYVRHLVELIKKTDANVLANYLLWRFVRHRVNNLDDRFQSAKQQFYFILFGREEAPPRWKNCISQVNSNMGMALGSMFVRKYFDEMSKNDTLTMTREIQQSFRELLRLTDWIDNETKKLAAHKVDAMMLRIGYPDFILNSDELNERYKEVTIHPDKYFENILNILQHLTKMEQSRYSIPTQEADNALIALLGLLGQPVNKTLWNTAPAVVNAYYSRNKNQIMFPAGILQPPFYHRHFPRSLKYGGIGVVIALIYLTVFLLTDQYVRPHLEQRLRSNSIKCAQAHAHAEANADAKETETQQRQRESCIHKQTNTHRARAYTCKHITMYTGTLVPLTGHEITHGFDDKGRLFDCDGNLHRWWSDGAIEAFHRRAQCLIDQYGRYVVPDVNMKLDGVNTQGENIADNGGVKQAFRAYKRWLARHGAAGETLPGLNHTHTQLFFLNFAQVWCGAMRPEAMRNKLKTAVHAPGRFRVIGTLSNSEDFAREFRCPTDSPMNPTKKCSVW